MAFVFDSTPGSATANSFVSVTDADDYFSGRFENDLWTALPSATKQRLLATATRRLDAENYYGSRHSQTQSLQFPRDVVFNRDSYPYASNEIPRNLKYATCELAYFALKQDDRIVSEIELHDAQGLDAFSVGPLSYQFNGRLKMDALPETVKNELKAIGHQIWLGGATMTQMFR